MAIVTALRRARGRPGARRFGGEQVEVELDGRPWRVLPLEAVLVAGIDSGVELDRPRARQLARELRRLEARTVALGALRYRDHTAASLRRRLEARGVARDSRDEAVETLTRAGVVDDRRFAQGRAAALAARGAGDRRIRDDLERQGVDPRLLADAIAALEPEHERARRLIEVHGTSQKALRRLAANGFSEESLEHLVADSPDAELRYEGFI